MSVSSSVVFLRSKDNKYYQKMLQVKHACDSADVDLPEEVDKYFGGYGGDNLDEYPLEVKCDADKEVGGEYWSGIEIKVSDIPDDVEIIRFVNS